jgi:multidrug resistance efflux pump
MASDANDLKLAFGAQKALLQALNQTQSEHTATLADHTARLTRLEAGMTEVRAGVHTIIGLLDRELGD